MTDRYTYEPHGDGYALYDGRVVDGPLKGHRHGYNLANMLEVDRARLKGLLSLANRPGRDWCHPGRDTPPPETSVNVLVQHRNGRFVRSGRLDEHGAWEIDGPVPFSGCSVIAWRDLPMFPLV